MQTEDSPVLPGSVQGPEGVEVRPGTPGVRGPASQDTHEGSRGSVALSALDTHTHRSLPRLIVSQSLKPKAGQSFTFPGANNQQYERSPNPWAQSCEKQTQKSLSSEHDMRASGRHQEFHVGKEGSGNSQSFVRTPHPQLSDAVLWVLGIWGAEVPSEGGCWVSLAPGPAISSDQKDGTHSPVALPPLARLWQLSLVAASLCISIASLGQA